MGSGLGGEVTRGVLEGGGVDVGDADGCAAGGEDFGGGEADA